MSTKICLINKTIINFLNFSLIKNNHERSEETRLLELKLTTHKGGLIRASEEINPKTNSKDFSGMDSIFIKSKLIEP